MNINFDFSMNIITAVTVTLVWCYIGFQAYRLYKNHPEKISAWKSVLVLLIGIFTFSFNIPLFDSIIRIPILPLGVWIIYLFLKGRSNQWHVYRPLAWLGFFANFLFLLAAIASLVVYPIIFSEKEVTTYISNVENASIIPIHPSAKEHSLNKDALRNEISKLKQDRIFSAKWYEETYINASSNKMQERFPYLLVGTTPKWGSGLKTITYIEKDGKGILISTSKKQFYFRCDATFFKEGE